MIAANTDQAGGFQNSHSSRSDSDYRSATSALAIQENLPAEYIAIQRERSNQKRKILQ